MNDTARASTHLSVDAVAHQHFATNFIRTAVCEVRFPTLFELEDERPPAAFARALRKEYPTYGTGQRVNVSAAAVAKTNTHVFKSRNGIWTVNLTSHTLSLETSRYDSFVDFEARICLLIEACSTFIDSDFFTRLGLRYVNALPYDRAKIAEWINPSLADTLASGVYGEVSEFAQAIRGSTEVGGYYFQHGIGADGTERTYGLDFDFYAENVQVMDATSVVKSLHKRQFEMFMWTLGEKAKMHLLSAKASHA